MYGLIREGLAGISLRRGNGPRRTLAPTVLFLGLTSLFTDISSEMVTAVLPLYVLFQQEASVLQFGVVDGLYQGASAVFRLITGFLADRLGKPKEIATAGYGLSALARVGMVAMPSAYVLAGLIAVDRFGKGIRTAPRDALISRSAEAGALGAAFGVHRALDTVGAMLGPILTFTILTLAPRRFDAVFVASLSFAVIGVAVIGLFVRNPPDVPDQPPAPATVRASVGTLLRLPTFPMVLVAAALISFFTVSDAFVYLIVQRETGMGLTFFPLLFVGTSIAYFLLAIPVGRIADRFGRMQTFLAGQLLLLAVYAVLLVNPSPVVTVVAALALFGAFYASTDGVLTAAASATLPTSMRTSGLSIVGTTVALSKLASSLAFAALWAWSGPTNALMMFAAGLAIASIAGVVGLRASRGADAAAA